MVGIDPISILLFGDILYNGEPITGNVEEMPTGEEYNDTGPSRPALNQSAE